MKYILISLVLVATTFFAEDLSKNIRAEERQILDDSFYQQSEKMYLLSFPRSGNTWLRYCIEFLSKHPTIRNLGKNFDVAYRMNCPLGWSFDLDIDMEKTLIWKVHYPYEIEKFDLQPDTEKLIFILRNPKENITRFLNRPMKPNDLKKRYGNKKPYEYYVPFYFDNIKIFDEWPNENKILVYYEDLISNPRRELERIVNFLGASDKYLEEFFNQFELHKANAIKIYNLSESGSKTEGNHTVYHSTKIPAQERRKIDRAIEEKYPRLWEKYLIRYAD